MTDITTTEPARAPTVRPIPERTRISARLRQGIRLLASGECRTQKAACVRINMDETHFSRMLARPDVQAFMRRESLKTIASSSMRAANRMVELIDADSEHVAAQVSQRILQSEGILKSDQASINVGVHVNAGLVLDLREPEQPTTIVGEVVGRDETETKT